MDPADAEHHQIIANWREIVVNGLSISEKALILLLPIAQAVAAEIEPQLDQEQIVISKEWAKALVAFMQSSLAEQIAATEFMDWAVAHAPFALVSNMARVGLLV